MSDDLGFNSTAFNSANNNGSNVTLFAPTTIDIESSDVSLALMSISTSADYMVDCCMTIDVSWARAAFRWANNDAGTLDFSLHDPAEGAFSTAVKNALESPLNSSAIVARSGAPVYANTLGDNSQNENLAGHVLGYVVHQAVGRADMRHVVMNADEIYADTSAFNIAASFEDNLVANPAGSSDGQVMLELFNRYDVCNNQSRFDDLAELNGMDNDYTTSPFPFQADDKIVFKVRVHGPASRDDTIGAAIDPHVDSATGATTATITDHGGETAINPREWLVRLTLKATDTASNGGDGAGQLASYTIPSGHSEN